MTWNLVTYGDEKFEDKQEYLNSIVRNVDSIQFRLLGKVLNPVSL